MSDDPKHPFQVIEQLIEIVAERVSMPDFETVPGFEAVDGEKVVMVSIGLAETHITVLSDEPRRRSYWAAVYGWSALSDIRIGPDAFRVGLNELPRALSGQLRRYGEPVRTDGFPGAASAHLRSAISYILDRTIGDGAGYDRIVIAAPAWLHETVGGCLDLRPHIWNEIQDN